MAVNCVVPSRERVVDEAGVCVGLVEPGVYRVEGPEVPRLVARGVLPFPYLEGRSDFATRFLGCQDADDVRDVLLVEGAYPKPVRVDWRGAHDLRVKAARERVRKRRERA